MAEITLTIDGKKVKGQSEDSVLQICQKNGIYVPTLCHLDGLPDIGSCRMCIVDIQGPGRPRVSTACTTPATDGMVVNTSTPNINAMRKNILELLLSEGNHHCMYCLSSGDCELQDLAYRSGIEHIRFPRPSNEKSSIVDSSHRYLVMDASRCVLCYRCVRACNDLEGNRVLGIGGRGSRSQIINDMGGPRGKSSCVNCGMCVQVCPTGALTDRRSSYMGREAQVDRTKSTCMFCSVGCGEELIIRDNYLIRIEGDWDTEPNHGLMCVVGRYEPLYDEKRARAVRTMVRKEGKLERVVRDAVLNLVIDKIKSFPKESIGVLISTQATNEAMELLAEVTQKYDVKNVGCIEGPIPEPVEKECNLSYLADADMFIVVGEDLVEDHQVAGFFVKRGIIERTNQLVIIDEKETELVTFAQQWLKPNEVEKAVELAKDAKKPVVIYGTRAGKEMDVLRQKLSGKAKFLWMAPGVNSRGALAVGLGGSFNAESAKFVYILASEAKDIPEKLMEQLKKADFVAVQTSYIQPWDQGADVIIPNPTWVEKEGTTTNLEGRVQKLVKAIKPPIEVKDELETLVELMEKLGYTREELRKN
jgi:formate dehydrogenase major subunit